MSKRSLIDSIEVKTPCSEDWNEMRGSDKVRFCGHCSLSVNNISAMTRKQAMRLARESEGRICVRYVKNPQTNAPVFAGKLYQISRRAGIAAGVLGASLTLSTLTYAQGKPVLNKVNLDSQTEVLKEKDSDKDKTESKTASLWGALIDPNGAVIPGYQITLTNLKTNEAQITTSNEDGFFEFKNIASGIYNLKSEGKLGFREKEISNIEVRENENLKQNIMLDIEEIAIMGDIAVVAFRNPLHQAVSNDNLEEVKNLIARGENVNGKDENYSNITPLFLAVENGNEEIVETLLSFGAKVNAKDINRQTPLMRLDEDASPELVRTLIKFGAKVNSVDTEGNTALILASRSVRTEVLQILIDHRADINAQNKEGRAALMEAAEADNLENVRALLEAGADVNLKDKTGETAWDLTTGEEVEKLLESFGAEMKEN